MQISFQIKRGKGKGKKPRAVGGSLSKIGTG
jgi:hypothetical protein